MGYWTASQKAEIIKVEKKQQRQHPPYTKTKHTQKKTTPKKQNKTNQFIPMPHSNMTKPNQSIKAKQTNKKAHLFMCT